MAKPKRTTTGGRRPAAPRADSRPAHRGEDPSFARLLLARKPDAIVPEATQRLEGGRRRYAEALDAAAGAELEMLAKELQRLEKEAADDPSRLARARRLVAAVEADAAANRALRSEIERFSTRRRRLDSWRCAPRR